MKHFNCLFAIAVVYFLATNDVYSQKDSNKKESKTAFAKLEIVKPLQKIVQPNFSPDLEIIRKRIIEDLLQPSVNTEEIKLLIQSIQPDGSWPGINYDTLRTGFQHSEHLQNMLALRRA